MFTGLVQALGLIERTRPSGDGLRVRIAAGGLDLSDVVLGDSIAVNGCCLTVVERDGDRLSFDVSDETLRCAVGLDTLGEVNLEKSLRLADRLGGHLVLGHVDGAGTVVAFDPVAGAGTGSWRLAIDAPVDLARFIAPKGSIAVQGVSLTVNEIYGRRFSVNLIPHTLAVTTLKNLAPQAQFNLEVDVVARYVARLNGFDDPRGAVGG
jgi:riboflavin synthase